jgi:hypothetical protein
MDNACNVSETCYFPDILCRQKYSPKSKRIRTMAMEFEKGPRKINPNVFDVIVNPKLDYCKPTTGG